MTSGTHIDLGQAMIVMIEPTRDPERLAEWNRWYEHDHVYSGVLAGPGAFSYGRFVATRGLKDLRYPDPSGVSQPLDKGSYLSFFYLLAGNVEEHYAWSFPETARLGEAGRMNADRELVSLSLYDFVGSVNRDGWPVPAEISLDHRYPGVVALWIDRAETAPLGDLRAGCWKARCPHSCRAGTAAWLRRWFSRRETFRAFLAREPLSATDFSSPALSRSIRARYGMRRSRGSGMTSRDRDSAHWPLRRRSFATIPGTPTYSDQLW